jgi:hypothetical protein
MDTSRPNIAFKSLKPPPPFGDRRGLRNSRDKVADTRNETRTVDPVFTIQLVTTTVHCCSYKTAKMHDLKR